MRIAKKQYCLIFISQTIGVILGKGLFYQDVYAVGGLSFNCNTKTTIFRLILTVKEIVRYDHLLRRHNI